MVKLLNHLKGYVRIKITGVSPERFINLCGNKNILLWNIEKREQEYFMCISLNAYRQLRPIVKKTKTKVVLLERYGLPFLMSKLLLKKMFIFGFLFSVFFWYCSSFFIWEIRINGNYNISSEVFEDFLKMNEVEIGMLKKNLRIEELEKSIRKSFPIITWTCAKLTGTKLYIDLKENDAPIIKEDINEVTPKDMISDMEGTIVSMVVRKGIPKVKIGDVVTSDTILVEGKVPIYNDDTTIREYLYVEADADIYIQHNISKTFSLPYSYIRKVYTGRLHNGAYLRVGEKEIKFGNDSPYLIYDTVIKESTPEVFENFEIPVFWGTYTFREYQNTEYEYSVSEAEKLLTENINEFIQILDEKGVQIIEKNVKIDSDSQGYLGICDLIVIEQSKTKLPISMQEETTIDGEM